MNNEQKEEWIRNLGIFSWLQKDVKAKDLKPDMGSVLFCILHLLAIAFGIGFLFITIPLHILYGICK